LRKRTGRLIDENMPDKGSPRVIVGELDGESAEEVNRAIIKAVLRMGQERGLGARGVVRRHQKGTLTRGEKLSAWYQLVRRSEA